MWGGYEIPLKSENKLSVTIAYCPPGEEEYYTQQKA